MEFGHEQLDVYQLSLEYVAWAYALANTLNGVDRHARDQFLRASQSIPLNIAGGNGKGTDADRQDHELREEPFAWGNDNDNDYDYDNDNDYDYDNDNDNDEER